MVGIDNPKLEEIQVVSLMDSHPGDAARVARLKLEGDVAIASNEQALLGESQDATIEGLGMIAWPANSTGNWTVIVSNCCGWSPSCSKHVLCLGGWKIASFP